MRSRFSGDVSKSTVSIGGIPANGSRSAGVISEVETTEPIYAISHVIELKKKIIYRTKEREEQ